MAKTCGGLGFGDLLKRATKHKERWDYRGQRQEVTTVISTIRSAVTAEAVGGAPVAPLRRVQKTCQGHEFCSAQCFIYLYCPCEVTLITCLIYIQWQARDRQYCMCKEIQVSLLAV